MRARAYQTSTNLCTKWSKKKSAKTGIAYSKSKLKGTWKVVSTNDENINRSITVMQVYGKYLTVSLTKKGKLVMKDFNGNTQTNTSWVATGKTKGYEYGNYKKYSVATLDNKTLTMKDKSTGLQLFMKRA